MRDIKTAEIYIMNEEYYTMTLAMLHSLWDSKIKHNKAPPIWLAGFVWVTWLALNCEFIRGEDTNILELN